MNRYLFYIFTFTVMFTNLETSLFAEKFAVIVNSENNYDSSGSGAKTLLSQLFLKQRSSWPNNLKAKPFSYDQYSAEQQEFNKAVLGMNQTQLTQYWISVKQKNGETPPKEIRSLRLMLLVVAKYPGAFGVIPMSQIPDDAEGIKVLFELP